MIVHFHLGCVTMATWVCRTNQLRSRLSPSYWMQFYISNGPNATLSGSKKEISYSSGIKVLILQVTLSTSHYQCPQWLGCYRFKENKPKSSHSTPEEPEAISWVILKRWHNILWEVPSPSLGSSLQPKHFISLLIMSASWLYRWDVGGKRKQIFSPSPTPSEYKYITCFHIYLD